MTDKEFKSCGCKCCTDRTDCSMAQNCIAPALVEALDDLNAAINSFLDWKKINSSMALRCKMNKAKSALARAYGETK